MSIRIRKDGQILCAAMHPEMDGDRYLDDEIHYILSAELGVLMTDENHFEHGEWWWKHRIDNV